MAERCCDKDSDDDPICKCVRGGGEHVQSCGSVTDGLRSWGTGEAGAFLRRVRRWRVRDVQRTPIDSNYQFQNHRSDFDKSSDAGVVRMLNTIDVYEVSRFELLLCKYLEIKKKEKSSVTLLEKS